MYSCQDVEYTPEAYKELKEYEGNQYKSFNICVSKVPNSLSDDPHLLNAPVGHTLHVKKLRLFTGAQFIVPLTGDVFTMPGLPKIPASKKMNIK